MHHKVTCQSLTNHLKRLSLDISIDNIEQIDSKQLFIVNYKSLYLLFSYCIVVGYSLDNTTYMLTDKQYSTTTSRQLTMFSCMYECITMTQETIVNNLSHIKELKKVLNY